MKVELVIRRIAPAAALGLLLYAAPAEAQATRTWVSGVGDDANPCSRTAPCKTFAGAISKTAAGGEISVLDPGGFGAVTITKSISIVAEGGEGGVLAAGTNGIIVNVGPNDVVSLSGLIIEGVSTGLNGIRFLGSGALHVRNCLIRGFRGGTGLGVDIQATGHSRIFITDTTLAANLGGIRVKPNTAEKVIAFLDRVQIDGHSGTGVAADGSTAWIRMNASTVTNNGIGLSALNSGNIVSFGNNAINGNAVNGAPTSTQELK
jgi:hypothetical protein